MTLEENIQQLRDALTVTSAQTLRHETRLKDHEQWLEEHEARAKAHQDWLVDHERAWERHELAIAAFDERMAQLQDKIDKIADLILRGKGGNGDQG